MSIIELHMTKLLKASEFNKNRYLHNSIRNYSCMSRRRYLIGLMME